VKLLKSVEISVTCFYFFLFLSQSAKIGSTVSKNGVFSTFWYKGFSVEMPETSFLEYRKLKVSHISVWLWFMNFGLIGCKSTNKCAKMKRVTVGKYKCHQKIPWVWFGGTNISNFCLILNTYGARDQNIILMKNFNFFLGSAQNQIIVADIVPSKSYLRNLLMALIFSDYNFYVQNFHFCVLFCRLTANQAEIRKTTTKVIFKTHWASYIPKMTFNFFRKSLHQNIENHLFLEHSTRLRATETKIENKIEPRHLNSDTFRDFDKVLIFPIKTLGPLFH
jgi:hypothetical protein